MGFVKRFIDTVKDGLLRKRTEIVIHELICKNQLILDSINEGVGMFDRGLNALWVNRYLAARFGRTKEECVGTNIREYLPAEQYGELFMNRKRQFDRTFDTGCRVTFEDTKDGRWYHNRLYPVFKDGRVTAVTLCSTDITDKKTAEEKSRRNAALEAEAAALRRNEAEFLDILDGFSEAAWIKDLAGGRWAYSEQWLKRLGFSQLSPEETAAAICGLIHPDDAAGVAEEMRSVFAGRQTKYKLTYRLKVPDGSYIWVLDKGKVVYNKLGAPVRITGASTDITDILKTETIIRRQHVILKSINRIYEKALAAETIRVLGAACIDIIENMTGGQFSLAGEVGADGLLHVVAINHTGYRFMAKQTGQDRPPWKFEITGLYGSVIKSGKTLLTNDPAAHPHSTGTPDGHRKITAFLGVPFIRDGKVAGILATANREGGFRDEDRDMLEAITPTVFEVLFRKRAEETVRENEHLLRTVMDSSSDYLFIKDKDSRVVMVNKAYERVFGIDADKIIGKNDYELYSNPAIAREGIEKDRQVMQTGRALVCEESAMTVDGRKTYLLSKVPWRDTGGSIIGILGIAHDITALKEAENAMLEMIRSLKHSKDYINILYETTGCILASATPREDIDALCKKVMAFLDCHVYFNYLAVDGEPFLRLNACDGISEQQKKDIDCLPVGAAICGSAVRDGCRIVAENIQTTDDPRTVYIKPLGIRAYACHPLLADGKAIGSLAFGTRSRDRFSDEDLMLMKTVVESISVAVKRKRDEELLVKQAEELRAADHNKNEFLGTLSHELRNPLAAISAGLSLLEISNNRAQQERARAIMKRQLDQLCGMVDDLLDMTRITRNRIELKKEKLELGRIALSVADDLKPMFAEKGILFHTDISADAICIEADPIRVRQVIDNLLHNALKFTGGGKTVILSVYTEDGNACVGVKDGGIGIDPKFMPCLFEPFMQADKTIDRRNSGLGLGLSIVKGIAKLHGGSVTARSDGLGRGSEFTVSFPMTNRPLKEAGYAQA